MLWAAKYRIDKCLFKTLCKASIIFVEENSFTNLSAKSNIMKLLHLKSSNEGGRLLNLLVRVNSINDYFQYQVLLKLTQSYINHIQNQLRTFHHSSVCIKKTFQWGYFESVLSSQFCSPLIAIHLLEQHESLNLNLTPLILVLIT